MPKQDFKPPKPNRVIRALANACVSYALRWRSVVDVQTRAEDLERLSALRNERVVLTPNHPTNTEPAVVFTLGDRANLDFHYVACREAFDCAGGLWGWLIQRLGAYSIVRGALDRASFNTTKELIAKPASKVVIFPEGEVYSQNDSLLPFQTGVVQLAFWGLEEARKSQLDADVKLLPIAIRYRFVQDMTQPILDSIERLERAVGIRVAREDKPYDRLRRVGELVVAKLERQFNIEPASEMSLGDRMEAVKLRQLERAAEIAKVELKGGSLPDQMRAVINAVHRVVQDDSRSKSDYDLRLWEEERSHIQPALHELERLSNWIAVYDGYVAANPTPERIVHLLVRMEKEVLGEVVIRGKQIADVRIGSPLSLADRLPAYQADKRASVANVTHEVEASIHQMLDQMGSATDLFK